MTWLLPLALAACATSVAESPSPPPGAASATVDPAPPDEGPRHVVHPSEVSRRASPSGQAFVEILARGENAFLARMEILAGAKIPEHRDPTEEYIHILEGGGTIWLEGEARPLGPGDTVYMPANMLVRYENGPATTVAIQVFAGPEPAAKYDAWTPIAAE